MKRPSYRAAILWMVDNDDTTWVEDDEAIGVSVTAALIADMFGVPDIRVRSDLCRLMDKRAAELDATR